MTFYAIVNDGCVTLAADDPVVPATDVDALATAVDAARALSGLHGTMHERVRVAEAEARERGQAEGFAAGSAAAAEQLTERLLVVEQRTEREREALRARAVDNALGIVRRIASSLGTPATLAALARDAARELLPSAVVVVQVHPTQLKEVRARLVRVAAGRASDGAEAEAGDGDEAEAEAGVRAEAGSDEGDGGDERSDGGAGDGESCDVDVGRRGRAASDADADRTGAGASGGAAVPGTMLVVEPDEALAPDQCRLRTPGGVAVLAGLETQLRSIERHTRGALAEPPR